jgi:pyruvate ferredoxin oxidoreductase gamma subunit
MFQVRIHGRGGHGVMTAAQVLSVAAFVEGRFAQAFPGPGAERGGAPVVAFCRIDDVPIRQREPVVGPDVLIIQEPTLLHQVDVFRGLQPDGYVLVNSNHSVAGLGLADMAHRCGADRMITVPATGIARRQLGRPLPNAALLGGFAALTGIISLASVETAIREQFGGRFADGNVAAARDAFAFVRYERSATAELARA